jgi:hypothetical protein
VKKPGEMIKDKSSQFLLAGKQRDDYFSTELSKAVGDMEPALEEIIRRH